MLSKLKNPALLRFLGAVQHHSETSSTLLSASGYDPLELQVAVSAAQDLGLVEPTGEIHPSAHNQCRPRLGCRGTCPATEPDARR